jgi:hypothetical protein
MPRFFFHLRDHDLLHEDDEGTNLPSLYAALDEALRVRSELLGELNGRSELEFEIADDVGRIVLRIPIQERRPCSSMLRGSTGCGSPLIRTRQADSLTVILGTGWGAWTR